MAIYSLQCKIIGRGQQKSDGTVSPRTVVAAAAYRSGSVLHDQQTGVSYDYSKKQGVIYSEILLPTGAPARLRNRETLWNEVEALEKRCDAQFCRELVIALPAEFTHEQHIHLARSYLQKHFVDRGMCADFSLHDPDPPRGGQRNPHVHILVTMRDLERGRFGRKNRDWNQKATLEGWRELWAVVCNQQLERAGFAARIDHRSNKDRGLGRRPTVHLGVEVAAMERKGIRTEKGNINRSIRAHNAALDCGVESPTILAEVGKLWQRAFERRSHPGHSSASTGKAHDMGSPRQEGDTQRSGVQRRTYTLLRNVVRQGGGPAPVLDKDDALQGDENAPAKKKSIAQRLEELRQKGQKAGPLGKASRQPAQAAGQGKRSSIYDIKVMSSTLNFMAEHGISDARQLDAKVAALVAQVGSLESALADARNAQAKIRRLVGAARAGSAAKQDTEKLRGTLKKAEQLHGAALRAQATRSYAEAYAGKVLFRENYYKKFCDKIDAYHQAVKDLESAGLDEAAAPAQLQKTVEDLKAQLRQKQQKLLSAEHELKVAGYSLEDGQLLQSKAGELTQPGKDLSDELYALRGELWKWQRAQDTISNVREGKDINAERQKQSRNGKQDTPDR